MVDYTNQDHGRQGQEVLDLVSDCKGSVRNEETNYRQNTATVADDLNLLLPLICR